LAGRRRAKHDRGHEPRNAGFFIYSAVLGVAVSAVLLLVPESRTLSLGPYFWVLIGIGLFEAVAVYLRGPPQWAADDHADTRHQLCHRRCADAVRSPDGWNRIV
jgi:hypothetical protein